MRIFRIVALVLGSAWFFPVSCATGIVAGKHVVAAVDARNVERGDEPHPQFSVVLEPGEAGKPFRVVRLSNLPSPWKAGPPFTYLMSRPTGSITERGSDFSYRVIEGYTADQIIEVVERRQDGDNTIWSRYRANWERVFPLSSKMDYFGYMFVAMPYAFGGALALYIAGRLMRRRIKGPRT